MGQLEKTNMGYIRKFGGNVGRQVKSFASIRSWGDKNSAITKDGDRVERHDYIFAEGYNMVRCVPYELHFVYEDKSGKIGRWGYMCTCGSIAGIISYNDVKELMSPEYGEYLLACIFHTTTKQNTEVGRHADGSTE